MTTSNSVTANLRSFKIHLGELETRRIPVIEQDSFLQTSSRLRNLFSLSVDAQLTVTYKDSDGDLVTIGSEEEYRLALTLHNGKNTITLFLFVVNGNGAAPNITISAVLPSNPFSNDEKPKYRHPHKRSEKVPKPVARFVKDVTIPEGSEIEASAPFIKTWRFRNEGDIAWPAGVLAKYIGKGGSDRMGGPESIQIIGIVQPNTTVDVSIPLTAPNEPGHYKGYWRLFDSNTEKKFGPRFWVHIIVPSGSSSPMINSSDEDKKKKTDHKSKHEHKHGRHHKRSRDEKEQDDYVEITNVTAGQDGNVTAMVITDDSDKKKRKKEKREKKHLSKKSESSSSDSGSEEEGERKNKEKPKRVKMSELLGQLSTMGFNDKGTNIKLLKKFDRDIGKVVHALVEKIAQESPAGINNTTSSSYNQKN